MGVIRQRPRRRGGRQRAYSKKLSIPKTDAKTLERKYPTTFSERYQRELCHWEDEDLRIREQTRKFTDALYAAHPEKYNATPDSERGP